VAAAAASMERAAAAIAAAQAQIISFEKRIRSNLLVK